MHIMVDRFVSDTDTTISRVNVDTAFVCFGLEDEYREDKVPGETRIPCGTYSVALRIEGGFHERYSKRFPGMHQGMLHITNVPGFQWILIHCGNTDQDTEGCLLVGSQAITEPGDMKIINSESAYKRFYTMVVGAAASGKLTITFLDNDRLKAPAQRQAESDSTLPVSGVKMTKQECDELFSYNAKQRDMLSVGTGSLVGALIDELERNAETYIRLKNPVKDGYRCEYTLVQGRQSIIKPIATALGFKSVSESVLEVYDA
jgi:hypothetical protein